MPGFAVFPFPSRTPLRCPALRAVQTATFPLLTGAVDPLFSSRGAQGEVCWSILLSSPGSGMLGALRCVGSLVWAGCLPAFSVLPRPSPAAPEPLADGEGWLGWVCCPHPRLEHEVDANKSVYPDRLDLTSCHAKSSQRTGSSSHWSLPARDGVCSPPLGCNKVSRALPEVSDCLWR